MFCGLSSFVTSNSSFYINQLSDLIGVMYFIIQLAKELPASFVNENATFSFSTPVQAYAFDSRGFAQKSTGVENATFLFSTPVLLRGDMRRRALISRMGILVPRASIHLVSGKIVAT